MNKEKLKYAILKEIDNNNKSLTEKTFEVSEEDFNNIVNFLKKEAYLVGVHYYDDKPHLNIAVSLTEKGERYLNENSLLAKTYKGLKEIKEWIK